MRSFVLLGLALAVQCGPATAGIYKCVDGQGRITYTNDASNAKGCTQLEEDLPVSSIPSLKPPPAGPSNFPRVTPAEQEARDGSRRAILGAELEAEEKALEEARKALTEQEAVRYGNERNYQKMLDRLQPFKDKIELHQRNVEALKKEISNLH